MKHALISVVMVCLLFALSPVVAMAGDSGVVSAADGAFHFGFKRSVDGKLPSINEEGFKSIVDKHGAVFLGDTTRKEMFLTFDNGYENGYTPAILDTLKAKKVPAIFFVTGHYVKDQPALVKEWRSKDT